MVKSVHVMYVYGLGSVQVLCDIIQKFTKNLIRMYVGKEKYNLTRLSLSCDAILEAVEEGKEHTVPISACLPSQKKQQL